MTTKRHRRSRDRQPISAAWLLTLMAGELSTTCLPGWAGQANDAIRDADGWDYTPAGDRLWSQHGAALQAEAEAAGFEAFWCQKQTPSGAGFARWRARFLAGQQVHSGHDDGNDSEK